MENWREYPLVYMHSHLGKKFNKEPHSLISLSLSLSRHVHIRARVSAYAAGEQRTNGGIHC